MGASAALEQTRFVRSRTPVGHFRCCVLPTGASVGAPGDPTVLKNEHERTQLGLFLYARLRTAPPFQFAIIGVEVQEDDPYDRKGALYPFPGLMISQQMFDQWSQPRGFEPFAPGYLWVPVTEENRL